MKKYYIIFAATLLLTACNGKKTEAQEGTTEEVLRDMVDIDRIIMIEDIIGDSTLLNGTGENTWKVIGGGKIRVKIGDSYYLRMETKDGTVTSMTYVYDNEPK